MQLAAIAVLLYAVAFNQRKPLTAMFFIPEDGRYATTPFNIWEVTDFGRNRDYYVNEHFGDRRLEAFADELPEGATVGLRTGDEAWVYPFFNARRDLDYILLRRATRENPMVWLYDHANELDYLFCLRWDCSGEINGLPHSIVWEYYEGTLYAIDRTAAE